MEERVHDHQLNYVYAVLERIADHVSRLSETLSATEDFMTEHFHDILAVRPHAMEDFQRLDFLNQSIIDTSRLLKNLSDGCKEQTQLMQGLQLESTQNLVRPPVELPKSERIEMGDVDLF